jgi:hypothetical protein
MTARTGARVDVTRMSISFNWGTGQSGGLESQQALTVLSVSRKNGTGPLMRGLTDRLGRRPNIRKGTLLAWREEFARELRAQGIEANAMRRAVRYRLPLIRGPVPSLRGQSPD